MNLINNKEFVQFYKIRHIYEFMPSPGWFQTDTGVIFCGTFPKVCADFLSQIMDADQSVDNY